MSEALQRPQWRVALIALAIGLTSLVLLYWSTLQSMISIWLESETYSHGILVFPASAFLVWRSRDRLAGLWPRPSWTGLGLLALILLAWLVARLGSVQVIEQGAFVAAFIAICWCILGTAIASRIAFPLAFLFFAVPFGEVAIPALMEFTAWFTVGAIELTGVPVYRDGFFLTIPSGDFEIAKACSGIRYLIASFALGSLYAYLSFYSNWRRLGFMIFSLILPILANGLRAYGIVMIAHLSDMKNAVGVDHLIYGWLFFGLVMFVAFWVGSRFRDPPPADHQAVRIAAGQKTSARIVVTAVSACVLALAIPHAVVKQANGSSASLLVRPSLPAAVGAWQGPALGDAIYEPAFLGYDYVSAARYVSADAAVDVVIQTYAGPDNELINALNFLADGKRHKLVRTQVVTRVVDGEEWQVSRSVVRGRGVHRILLHWFQIGDVRTISLVKAKMFETFGRLTSKATPRSLVSVAIVVADPDESSGPLSDFLARHGQSIAACISDPAASACRSPSGAP